MGKPTLVYGPSMGPFESSRRNHIRRYVLNRVKIIALRDPVSMEYLAGLGVKRPLVFQTADSAFQDDVEFETYQIRDMMRQEGLLPPQEGDISDRLRVGITPTGARWNYKESVNTQQIEDEYKSIIARAIDYLVEQHGALVTFFPQLYGRSDDLPLIRDIRDRVGQPSNVRVLSMARNALEQQALVAQMDLFVGNRYHPVIFSLKGNVPVVCIAYEHKATGIMDMAGLREYTIESINLDYESLVEVIERALAHTDSIRKRMNEQVPRIRKLSLLNSLLVVALANCSEAGNLSLEQIKKEIEGLIQQHGNGQLVPRAGRAEGK
jgi:polysaccharide pyruvyl transferase WcaK-like protein